MQNQMTYDEMCTELGKGRAYVRNLQHSLGLYVPRREPGYSEAYLSFMHRVVSMRTFNVPVSDIQDLLSKEKKILELLHFDSMTDSPTWYLDAGDGEGYSPSRLLLTGYDVGFPIGEGDIQANLDFSERPPELFDGREMGEDMRAVIDLYLKRVEDIRVKVRTEIPVLEDALCWSEQAFEP